MQKLCFAFLLTGLSSCFLFKDYRKKEFAYTANGQPQNFLLLVPKGYQQEQRSDTAGIQLHSFRYADGAVLYTAYLADTLYELQSFDKTIHQPKPIGSNGLVYKGQNANEAFYREIRAGHLRIGYYGVPPSKETYFDSATNYAAMQRR